MKRISIPKPRVTPAFSFCILLLSFFAVRGLTQAVASTSEPSFRVLSLKMEASISPAESELMAQATAAAAEDDFDLLLVRLDTPGGTIEATRGIIKTILNSTVPVAVWVGPAGARAASAGVFIVAASQIAAMAPQTTIGAATPVGMGGEDVPGTAARKAINDVKSMVRAMAQARGRNVNWYMRAVEESDSITAQEALQLKVIDVLASSPEQLVETIGSGQVVLPDRDFSFSAEEYVIDEFEPGWRYRLLAWLLNPQVAYLLLLGGMAGLFFEFVSPGAFFPGVVGGICLLLALYALSILSTNVAGILLLLLGLVFFFLELAFISHGLLSIAGILALFFGSAILFPTGPGEQGLPLATIVVTVGGLAAILGFGVYLAAKAQVAKPASGREGLEDSIATVRHWRGVRGQVFAHGELWSARTVDNSELKVGDDVRILRVDGLVLTVERVDLNADFSPRR